MAKKRYAQVGTGGRARMYYEAICTTYKDTSELVGFCDLSQTRMDYTNKVIQEQYGYHEVPTYIYTEFDKMIEETKPDVVIVTSIDRTHHQYIIRAMELGCDVITEKPLTVDEKKAQAIVDAQKRTGRNLRVTFNYRYAPTNTKVRELIMNGVIGEVYSVHFEWLLNTQHGADYYRRWHRNKTNSGGLLVHKSTHHFDLVNFWLGTAPETVFAFGKRNFYGKENAERRGVTNFYYRSTDAPAAEGDPFAITLKDGGRMEGLYYNAEGDSGYLRDRSVFGDDISIEDTMSVLVEYKSGAQMSYSLNTYCPWEGFIVTFTGSKGRIEYKQVERSYINAGGDRNNEGAVRRADIMVYPLFAEPYKVDVVMGKGGHGGGDNVMLNDIFSDNPPYDPFHRAAGYVEGCNSILTGIAANKSIASGLPVKVDTLVKL
ncbi:MAG: Gfo/Idh/MocA family oxidoreductase [Firmicutes bacterium]|nr:Gfo/Idh/MocA family oxidoreductase [Bacillota bacterium]